MDTLFTSVQQGDLKSVIELLSKYPSGINAVDENGQTVLHYACALGQHAILNHMLSLSSCKIFQKDLIYGYTCLHIACLFDQQRVVNELLRRAGDNECPIDDQDNLGWTALHHASRNGSLEICKKLIASSARPDILNELNKTPCHYAAEYDHLSVLKYMFDYVEQQLTPPVITEEVLVNPTLLHAAAFNNHMRVVDWLRHREKPYPPAAKYRRIVNFNDSKSRDELPEDVAAVRGHLALRGTLSAYRREYEKWVQDIREDRTTLDRIKFCICGQPRVGKSALRQSLSKPYLQKLLGRNVEETEVEDVERCTSGIEITSLQLSGRDLFSVWDFAGQIESFITHHLFISTQSTVFSVLVDLTSSLDDQRAQLMRWLGFIKVRNLGQVPFLKSPSDLDKDIVPMPCHRDNLPHDQSLRASAVKSSHRQTGRNDSLPTEAMYGTVLQPVPVIIVGSHYDQIPPQDQQEKVATTQKLVTEMKERFEEYLYISPQLFPLNCLTAVSPEIRQFKEHLCEIRSNLLEVQPKYPRVVELVARKIESLSENSKQKVLFWDEMRSLVREEVNGLVSDSQLAFICKCLADAGVLVYFQEGALANYVFIDPGWLCQDVLGKALAPGSFPVSKIASIGSSQIPVDVLEQKFSEHIDPQHISIIIELLQQFDLCRRHKQNGVLEFPALLSEPLNPMECWQRKPDYVYSGRRLMCTDDSFPPGFFCRLQVQVSNILKQGDVRLFQGSFVILNDSFEVLVSVNLDCTYIDLIGRAKKECVHACSQQLDQIHGVLSKLIRDACPTIFLELQIISAADLTTHYTPPHCYMVGEVIVADSKGEQVTNTRTLCQESANDLLFFGDSTLQKMNSGKQAKIAYISKEIVSKIQDLLQDGEKDWRSLAKVIHLGQYIQLLESKSPDSTQLLLLKWGEKPKWTVQSLLYALKDIGRMDVYGYILAQLT